MLEEFMHWDWTDKLYWNNHWITEEVKKTSWFQEKLEQAISKKEEYINLEMWWKYEIDKSSNYDGQEHKEDMYIIKDTNDDTRNKDFKYSFWKIEWNFGTIHYGDGFYLYMEISDIYDFVPTYDRWFQVNILNSWASYYQDKWLWKIYNWKSKILYKIY